ncbi:MAG: sulfotransferase domain-containing protein [Methylocella sp.]
MTGVRSVDFFIVGVQKGGTTALDSYLRRNPFVQMADVKEVHFFDNESLDWSDPNYLPFHEHFEWSQTSGVIRGEATPIYIYWPNAMERIRRYNAASKLIVCLRHPAYRAHSHWRMETKRSADTLSFEDAISEVGRSRVRNLDRGVHRVYSYVERGFYAHQIRRLRELFPPEQLLFLRTDDLWTRTENTLSRVYRFSEP